METKTITPAQLKKIQTMFSNLGLNKEDKQGIINRLTYGRATSTKDITFAEAKYLIGYLLGENKPNETYRKECASVLSCIYRLSFDIGISYGDTPEDRQMNYAKINKFCRERGTVKKDITAMNLNELQKTRKQFKAIQQNHLDRAVKQLINKSLNEKKNEKVFE